VGICVLLGSALVWAACGGGSDGASEAQAGNRGAGGESSPAAAQGEQSEEGATFGVTLGQDVVPREQFAMGVAMIASRRLCGTQRMCFEGVTPDRCVRDLGDAVLAYAIEGADLPDPVPPERQSSFLDRELQPLAMMVFAQHAESGERRCSADDAITQAVVVRPEGCVRLENDTTPCGR
jgi:hypothetical protein